MSRDSAVPARSEVSGHVEYVLDDWLLALGQAGCRPRESGGGWSALCPSHDDKHPSLTLREGDKQEVVAHCHAGCEFSAIRAALGLGRGVNGRAGLQVAGSAPAKGVPPKPKPLPAGAHVYRDADGRPLMATLRRDLPKRRQGVLAVAACRGRLGL